MDNVQQLGAQIILVTHHRQWELTPSLAFRLEFSIKRLQVILQVVLHLG